jgi:transglutaminase-like putative cysteine protease
LDIPARLIVGHLIQSASKEGKGYLSNNNGHARTEIWNGTERIRLDATPIEKENGEKSGENGGETSEGTDNAEQQEGNQQGNKQENQQGNQQGSEQEKDGS